MSNNELQGVCVSPENIRDSQSGAGGSRATQTGSPKGEESGSEQIKRPTALTAVKSRGGSR